MNTNQRKITRRPGGLFTVGTTGWLVALYYWLWELTSGLVSESAPGNRTASARTVLAIESAQSSRQMELRIGPGHPLVRLPEEDGFVFPPRNVHDLAEECVRHRETLRYGEKLKCLPPGDTEDGVGAIPLVALVSGLANKPQIDRMIEQRILAQRDRNRLDRHQQNGQSFTLGSTSTQIIAGNFGGGTAPGLALFIASRIAYYCRKYGLPYEIVLFGLTPSALSGGDIIAAQGNFVTFIRQAVIAMMEPNRIVFRTFSGEELRHNEPLVHRIVPWSPSSGRLTVGTRDELAAQMALAAAMILDTGYGAFSEAQFRDHQRDMADNGKYGFRGFARMGLARWAVDKVRNQAVAQAEGTRLVAETLLEGNTNS